VRRVTGNQCHWIRTELGVIVGLSAEAGRLCQRAVHATGSRWWRQRGSTCVGRLDLDPRTTDVTSVPSTGLHLGGLVRPMILQITIATSLQQWAQSPPASAQGCSLEHTPPVCYHAAPECAVQFLGHRRDWCLCARIAVAAPANHVQQRPALQAVSSAAARPLPHAVTAQRRLIS
jgi:hypothetical protein